MIQKEKEAQDEESSRMRLRILDVLLVCTGS